MNDLQKLHLGEIRFPLVLPFDLELSNVKSSCDCRWVHPVKIDTLGSWRIGHQIKMDPVLDLIVIIPQVHELFYCAIFLWFVPQCLIEFENPIKCS